jgi:predicted nucleotidyltransferase/DNA-binding transcriptional ArsR family regulator
MRIHDPLDKILNSEGKVKILRFLCKAEVEWSGRQIAREIKVSPAACHKALRELNNERVLLLRSVGKSYLYRLNERNLVISKLLKPLYGRESKIPDKIYEAIIRNVPAPDNIISIAVLGSIKKKEERAASDIDLLVLVKNLEDKERVEGDFGKINEKIVKMFGSAISPYIQSLEEFKLKHKRGLPLVRNILKSHKLLFGRPLEELLQMSAKKIKEKRRGR